MAPPPAGARLEALLARHWWRARPSTLSRLLLPLAWLYTALAAVARARGRAQAARVRLPVPVIVVGNLVVGGAGKTPVTIALVQALRAAGRRPGIVSRGFGRRSTDLRPVRPDSSAHEVGDEPLLMQRRTGVPVWVGRQRAAAAAALCAAQPEVDVLVADDGLQHHALPRVLEIVVFDERGSGNGLPLPAGPLREPLPAPDAAPGGTAAVPRRVIYAAAAASTALPGGLAPRRADRAWPLAAWWAGDEAAAVPLASLAGRPLHALAGIGAPQKFFGLLQAAGLDFTPLPQRDHADYAGTGPLPWPDTARAVITTEKDAVKLRPGRVGAVPVWVVPLDLTLPAGLIDEVLAVLAPHTPAQPSAQQPPPLPSHAPPRPLHTPEPPLSP